MSNLMNIGITALSAYQNALNVASQNIANADTPFYSRRVADFQENPMLGGVRVADVRRIFDDAANEFVQAKNSDKAYYNIYSTQMNNFEPLLDTDATSIGKYITDSLGALRQVETSFTSGNRSLFLDKLTALAQQFQSVNAEINKQLNNINETLQTEVTQVNNLLGEMATVNADIIASKNNPDPSLLDQRENIIQKLSQYFDFSRSTDSDGFVDLVLSNGMSLLQNVPPIVFQTMSNPSYSNIFNIGAYNGTATIDVTNVIQSGEIAGWVKYRADALQSTQRSLGRLALVITQSLNAQNKLGIDANDNLGSAIFTDINTPSAISNRVFSNSNNTGSLTTTVTINNVNQIETCDYRMQIGAAGAYQLIRLSDNSVASSGTITGVFPQSISADGFTISITGGTFNKGDQYIISPTNGAANNMTVAINDPSSLALGWPVVGSNGTASPGSDGNIVVDSIVNTSNAAFSVAKQLNPPINIKFSVSGGVTQYTLYNANTNALIEGPINYVDGAPIFPTPGSYDPGYRVHISGKNVQAGDTFSLNYNTNPTGDDRNAVAMAALYQSGTVLGSNGQLVDFRSGYNLVANDISVKTNNGQTSFATANTLYNSAMANRDAISGVSLEEETMNLAEFQTAYQASAQILQVAKTVFDILVSLGR